MPIEMTPKISAEEMRGLLRQHVETMLAEATYQPMDIVRVRDPQKFRLASDVACVVGVLHGPYPQVQVAAYFETGAEIVTTVLGSDLEVVR